MSENQEERLRNWYLARLRRRALEKSDASQLTPAALIAADNQMIELLITERSKLQQRRANSNPLLPVYIWLAGVLALGILALVVESFDVPRAIAVLYRFSVGLVTGHVSYSRDNGLCSWPIAGFFWGYPLVCLTMRLFLRKQ